MSAEGRDQHTEEDEHPEPASGTPNDQQSSSPGHVGTGSGANAMHARAPGACHGQGVFTAIQPTLRTSTRVTDAVMW